MANIVVEDHAIRIVVGKGLRLDDIALYVERVVPTGLIKEGQVADELAFSEFMQSLVDEYGLKKADVRFYAPNSLVMMRQVDIPNDVKDRELKAHFELEVGISLHLPFEEPLIDVYPLEQEQASEEEEYHESPSEVAATEETESTRRGLLFAASSDEVMKYTEIFEDVGLHPIAVDIQALGVYRYFYYLEEPPAEQVHLFFELNLTSVNISVFYNHQLEFLRFEQLDMDMDAWAHVQKGEGKVDFQVRRDQRDAVEEVIVNQVEELGRIMNFYRYSQHQGERRVDEIIVSGDYPELEDVCRTLELTYDLPVRLLNGWMPNREIEVSSPAFVPALGLALKGSVK